MDCFGFRTLWASNSGNSGAISGDFGPPKSSKKLRICLEIVIRRPSKAFEGFRRPWDAKSAVLKVLWGGLGGLFWSPNLPKTQKNHDLKTLFGEEVFSETFFKDSVRFSEVWGPSEPLKSWFSHGRYCNFEKIMFFPPGAAPEAFWGNSGPISGDLGPQNRSQKLS